ncbi:hypothetical protein NDU88_006969 [Pleurodeles waltl]|uniref:Uncharacterized protein n=1 Tax=Pleurodeles waltl TaxID=8319 RepID=A0AAV7MEZ9_PLEWA|nr:hypothetical protein NDU88_006969 [Pleurodeles waltl]
MGRRFYSSMATHGRVEATHGRVEATSHLRPVTQGPLAFSDWHNRGKHYELAYRRWYLNRVAQADSTRERTDQARTLPVTR